MVKNTVAICSKSNLIFAWTRRKEYRFEIFAPIASHINEKKVGKIWKIENFEKNVWRYGGSGAVHTI